MSEEIEKEQRLRRDVKILAEDIGERNIYRYEQLQLAADFIEHTLADSGYQVARQTYIARDRAFSNLEAEIRGEENPNEIILVGAHYDTARNSPGANDNGSAIAALFELARQFAGKRLSRTLRFVAFTNEEHPFTRTPWMGSRVYARRCRERGENIRAMICLETIGYCSDRKGSQRLSFNGLLLPSRANFLALVGNKDSKSLLHKVETSFRLHRKVRGKALVLPTNMPGAWSSDHWCFWQEGYPALMLTDTALLRYNYYHRSGDTPEKVRYDF